MMDRKNSPGNYIVLPVFILFSVIGILHHAMWLDEVNCWLTAKESHSFSELVANCHNSGQPLLWNILLFSLARVTGNIIYMQFLHIAISIAAAYIFLTHSPFSFLQKILIVFGYYFLFEYNLISRNYNLTWLLLVLFCYLFSKERKNYFLLLLILTFLANTHLLSLILSLPLFIIVLFNFKHDASFKRSYFWVFIAIFFMAVLLSVSSIIPTDNTAVMDYAKANLFSSGRVSKAFSFFVRGFFPLPIFTSTHFWNSNFFIEVTKPLSIILTVISIVVPFIIFYTKKKWLLFYYVPSFSVMLMLYSLDLHYGVRYMGYCFLIFIVSLWLSRSETEKTLSSAPFVSQRVQKIIAAIFIWSVLICQFVAGIYAYGMNMIYPFSEGKTTAEYITTRLPGSAPVFVVPSQSGPSISAYLGRNIFYPDRNYSGSYFQWNIYPKPSCETVFDNIRREADIDTSRTFALVFASNDDSIKRYQALVEKNFAPANYSIEEKRVFKNAIVAGENYEVYIVERRF